MAHRCPLNSTGAQLQGKGREGWGRSWATVGVQRSTAGHRLLTLREATRHRHVHHIPTRRAALRRAPSAQRRPLPAAGAAWPPRHTARRRTVAAATGCKAREHRGGQVVAVRRGGRQSVRQARQVQACSSRGHMDSPPQLPAGRSRVSPELHRSARGVATATNATACRTRRVARRLVRVYCAAASRPATVLGSPGVDGRLTVWLGRQRQRGEVASLERWRQRTFFLPLGRAAAICTTGIGAKSLERAERCCWWSAATRARAGKAGGLASSSGEPGWCSPAFSPMDQCAAEGTASRVRASGVVQPPKTCSRAPATTAAAP